jgi:type III pantothenate kinase
MLLAVDIGNTNVTLGVFDAERIAASWRLSTDPRRLPDEYALQLSELLPMKGVKLADVDAISMCSVVPPLTQVFEEASRTLFGVKPLIVGAGTRTGVRVRYDSPHDVGADRVVDAAAAYHFHGGPAVVVDFGTATVFDAISADGAYLGGAISPGLGIAAESLYQSTSMLRRVEMTAPETAIGTSTAHSMQSGLVFGYAGLVEAMVRRFKDELGDSSATVIGTGGLAELMAQETSVFDIVDQELTLRGLAYIYGLNALDADKRGS